MKNQRRDFLFGNRLLTVIVCNLEMLNKVDKEVEVIVSSDDNYLTHGGGVSAAVWDAAGTALNRYVSENRPKLSLADVWPSPSGDLNLKAIYHAITLDFDFNKKLNVKSARDLYGKILDLAVDSAVRKIGLPLLGTGAGRLELDVSANAFSDALHSRAFFENELKHVYLSCLPDTYQSLCRVIEKRQVQPIGQLILAAADVLADEYKNDISKYWNILHDASSGEFKWSAILLFETVIDGLITIAGEKRLKSGKKQNQEIRIDRVTLGYKYKLLHEVLKEIDRPLEREINDICLDAINARNKLTHASDSTSIEEILAPILEASGKLAGIILKISGKDKTSYESSRQLDISPPFEMIINEPSSLYQAKEKARGSSSDNIRKTIQLKPAKEKPESPAQYQIGYTQPVRELCKLLIEEMDTASREELIHELGDFGYSGDGNMRILEYCVRIPDPVGILVSHIGAPRLRKKLKEFGYSSFGPMTDANVLARQMLSHFGFPVMPTPRGLHSIVEKIEQSKSRLLSMDDKEKLSGSVTQTASALEYLFQLFIRFLCRILLEEPPEPYLQRKSILDSGMRLDKCSLGKLIEILIIVSKEASTRDTAQARVLRSLLSKRQILPEEKEGLPELRNKFAHFNRAKEEKDITSMRQLGREFFEHAEKVLKYLADPEYRIFPRVIKITSILIDEWGRRRIEAIADNGQYESLFVDEILEPGAIYLMHPLSNPMRVDPILIPAGDLEPQQNKKK